MTNINTTEVSLASFIEVGHEISFDEDVGLQIVSLIFAPGDDDPEEVKVPVAELVDDVVDLCKMDHDYSYLYCVAHELTRFGEILRDTASRMEDAYLAEDMFDR